MIMIFNNFQQKQTEAHSCVCMIDREEVGVQRMFAAYST